MTQLYRIEAPHFVAGFCVDAKGLVWEAAPVLTWMREKPITFITDYCKHKGWKLQNVTTTES
jgi:hypothetical protein